jgi:hypothetical protein
MFFIKQNKGIILLLIQYSKNVYLQQGANYD